MWLDEPRITKPLSTASRLYQIFNGSLVIVNLLNYIYVRSYQNYSTIYVIIRLRPFVPKKPPVYNSWGSEMF